jgi:hypothetical protein
MNENETGAAAQTALSIIRGIGELAREDPPRPLLVRLAWFCAGAVFVLASARMRPGRQEPSNA